MKQKELEDVKQEMENSEDSSTEENQEEQNPSQEGEESQDGEATPTDNTSDEPTVPYSRFKEVNDEKKQALEKANKVDELEKKIEEFRQSKGDEGEIDVDDEFRQIVGDDEYAKQFYQYLNKIQDKAAERAIEQFQEQQKQSKQQEEQEIEQAKQKIKEDMEDLEYAQGVKLTGDSDEARRNRNELLDIVEQYSYGDDVMPMDKAYEIWNMKRSKSNASNKSVAQKSGTSTRSADSGGKKVLSSWDSISLDN